MNITEKLVVIQTKLKAPKGQYNSFGKYHYRSCEDITEAAKPVCRENGVALTMEDQIVMVGDRFYIEATARLTDIETGASISVSAYAREEDAKKGMDAAQLTGATSSYARKYALSGLFALDDTKDADYLNNGETTEKPKAAKKPAPELVVGSPAAEPKNYVCVDCGKPFEGFTAASGRVYSAEQVYEITKAKNKDGAARCKECREKAGMTKEGA